MACSDSARDALRDSSLANFPMANCKEKPRFVSLLCLKFVGENNHYTVEAKSFHMSVRYR